MSNATSARFTIARVNPNPECWSLVVDGKENHFRLDADGWRQVARFLRGEIPTREIKAETWRMFRDGPREDRVLTIVAEGRSDVVIRDAITFAAEIDRVLDEAGAAGWREPWTADGTMHAFTSGPPAKIGEARTAVECAEALAAAQPETLGPMGQAFRAAIDRAREEAGSWSEALGCEVRAHSGPTQRGRWEPDSPRFVVMRGAEAVGRMATGPNSDPAFARSVCAQLRASPETARAYHWAPATAEGWFVVDTHAPVEAEGIPRERVSIADAEVAEIIKPIPNPPTDDEIVAAMEGRMRANECSIADIIVRDRIVTYDEMSAAWSHVLAAKVRASDEKRRRDAMVWAQVDDVEET